MFKKLYSINSQVNKGFLIESDLIIFQEKSSLKKIFIISKNIVNESIIKEELQKIQKWNDGYLGMSNGIIAYFNKDLITNEVMKIRFSGYVLYENKYLISVLEYNYVTFQGIYGLYDLQLNKLLWKANAGENIRIAQNRAFTLSPKEVGKRDLITGESEWIYRIENENFVPDLIGVYKNLALFGLQKKDRLIAFEMDSGALKWERKSFPSLDLLDQEKGVIHSISSGYCKSDANSGEEIDVFIDREYFKSVGIFSQRNNYAIVGDYLITTDHQKGVIGAFNTNIHQFDWVHEEEGVSFPSPNPIVYHDPYLVVHDNKGSLHIFQKE